MSDASVHIGAWEAAGLLDSETADRLRAAAAIDPPTAVDALRADPPPSAVAALFGPAVTIAEVFAYLGGAFLIASWTAFTGTVSSGTDRDTTVGIMSIVAAVVLSGFGLWLRGRGERASRAAGVTFLVATGYAAAAAAAFAARAGVDWPAVAVLSAGAALAVAAILRVAHPAMLTQIGVLTSLTTLAAAVLAWIQSSFFEDTLLGEVGRSGPDPILLVVGSAIWWLATAVVIGLIGLAEARFGERENDAPALRRAAISRFWAGLTAVIGLSVAVRQSAYTPIMEYARVLEPWIGIVALLILSAVLVERAFRRDATSFIYAAALGLILALTDLNLSYLSSNTEVALLIEGLILLAVGVAADRLRRRIGQRGAQPPVEPGPDQPIAEAI